VRAYVPRGRGGRGAASRRRPESRAGSNRSGARPVPRAPPPRRTPPRMRRPPRAAGAGGSGGRARAASWAGKARRNGMGGVANGDTAVGVRCSCLRLRVDGKRSAVFKFVLFPAEITVLWI
jgi:hypothetical protein